MLGGTPEVYRTTVLYGPFGSNGLSCTINSELYNRCLRRSAMSQQAYAALGDSLTAGQGDPDAQGRPLGWAPRVLSPLPAPSRPAPPLPPPAAQTGPLAAAGRPPPPPPRRPPPPPL